MADRKHIAVVDLGFGDAGKGSVTDWLGATRPVSAVIRFNGGAQAAHHVVRPDGVWHKFSQFGSATFHGVPTFLSRFMLVDPIALAQEGVSLASKGVASPFDLISVDRRALVVTPYHRLANQQREKARGRAGEHGTCGMGIGETMRYSYAHPEDALRVEDCADRGRLRDKLALLRECLGAPGGYDSPGVESVVDTFVAFYDRVRVTGDTHLERLLREPCLFEGAQGVLLDEYYGFHPYTTWSTTTYRNAIELLMENDQDPWDLSRLGVMRAYTTRHGNGPMPSYDEGLTMDVVERHNRSGAPQGLFRNGHFDMLAHQYAVRVAEPDGLAITHLDRTERVGVVSTYESHSAIRHYIPINPVGWTDRGVLPDLRWQSALTDKMLAARGIVADIRPTAELIGSLMGKPVYLESRGPTHLDKLQRVST